MALHRPVAASRGNPADAIYSSPDGFSTGPDAVGSRLRLAAHDDRHRMSFRASALVMLAASLVGWVVVYGLFTLLL